ncbi:hypothetical protein TCAL_05312 [Tigriopus californicus]|uniref:SH3 domain-containing protein n=1 Tax=Tigriopus californicus TaxID=6832 RepID=A0A553PHS5_TIGCA|nr:SH3 domain-containing protein Dlish-like [Tigriopus californicus]TRY77238.1 hypothetical protein TCAL_05312 [Tigriopus californicus]
MAFLCPVRIKRNKKKKPLHDDSLQGPVPSMGRITGSASIETLVRVGIEKENGLGPESKMVVLHDFTPCVDDELEVKRGQIVHVLYQENDWVYVISEENKEGFIPHSYCAQFGSQLAGLALNVKKKLPRDGSAPFGMGGSGGGPGKATSMNGLPQISMTSPGLPSSASQGMPPGVPMGTSSGGPDQTDSENSSLLRQHQMGPGSMGKMLPSSNHNNTRGSQPHPLPPHNTSQNDPSRSNSLMSESSSQPDIHPFYKEPSGRYIVLYTYQAQDENDLNVERGQCVTVLNSDDPDWCWVAKYDQTEGFVPSGFIYPLDAIHRHQNLVNGTNQAHPQHPQQQQQKSIHQLSGKPGALPMGHPTMQHHEQGLPVPQAQPRPPPLLNNNNIGQSSAYPVKGNYPPPDHGFNGLPTVTRPMGSVGSSGPSSFSTSGMNSLGVVGSTHSTAGLPISGYEGNNNPAPPPLPSNTSSNGNAGGPSGGGDNRYSGTELVMLYDYKAQAPDDLSVRRGDWVYADLSNQTVDGWLWSYSPKTRKYGFIPKAYARPPAMTSL